MLVWVAQMLSGKRRGKGIGYTENCLEPRKFNSEREAPTHSKLKQKNLPVEAVTKRLLSSRLKGVSVVVRYELAIA